MKNSGFDWSSTEEIENDIKGHETPSAPTNGPKEASDTMELLTTTEAARFLCVTKKALRGMAAKGRVSAYKLGRNYRFLRVDLLKLLVRAEK